MASKSKRSCYVVSSWKTDIRPIVDSLKKHGLTFSVADIHSPSVSIVDRIRNQIDAADFVIGIFGNPHEDTNVFYEIGLAHGLDKRVLIFATDPKAKLPFEVERLNIVRSDLSNSAAVDFAIDQLISAPPKSIKARPARPTSISKPLGRQASHLLERLNKLPETGSEYLLTELVNDLLHACKLDVIAESKVKDIGVDFAIWSDELEPFMGNPLIVEVKKKLGRKVEIVKAGDQLAKYLERASADWALLIYQLGVEEEDVAWNSLSPKVIPLRLDKLINRLRDQSLADVVRDRRNQVVHGVNR